MKDVTDRCRPRDSGFKKKIFFAKYLYLRRREGRPAQPTMNVRHGGLRFGRQRTEAVTVPGAFDLLLKPVYTACRVWLLRHPFRSVASV